MTDRNIDWTTAERPWECKYFGVERVGGWHRIVSSGGAIAIPVIGAPGSAGCTAVMVRTMRPATDLTMLEFPRGGAMPHETGIETALRELREETGYIARSNPVVVGSVAPDAGLLATQVPVVLIEVDASPSGNRDDEALQIDLVEWGHIPRAVTAMGGCGLTLAAWAMADLFIAKREKTTAAHARVA